LLGFEEANNYQIFCSKPLNSQNSLENPVGKNQTKAACLQTKDHPSARIPTLTISDAVAAKRASTDGTTFHSAMVILVLRLVKSEFALLFEIQKCSGDVAYTFAQR
jgi:hypothetical protein